MRYPGLSTTCPKCGQVATYERTYTQPGPFNDLTGPEPDRDGWGCEECGWEHEATDEDYAAAYAAQQRREKSAERWRRLAEKYQPKRGVFDKQAWFALVSGEKADSTPAGAEVATLQDGQRWVTLNGETYFEDSIEYARQLDREFRDEGERWQAGMLLLTLRRSATGKLSAIMQSSRDGWGWVGFTEDFDDPTEDSVVYDEKDLELSESWEDFCWMVVEQWHRAPTSIIGYLAKCYAHPEQYVSEIPRDADSWLKNVRAAARDALKELYDEAKALEPLYETA